MFIEAILNAATTASAALTASPPPIAAGGAPQAAAASTVAASLPLDQWPPPSPPLAKDLFTFFKPRLRQIGSRASNILQVRVMMPVVWSKGGVDQGRLSSFREV